MPVSPEQCRKNFEESDKKDLEKLQSDVDAYLLKNFYGDKGQIVISHMKSVNERVINRFIENYKNVGWKTVNYQIKKSLDQRDPDSMTITLSTIATASGSIYDMH